jgi:VanZ family protein
MFLATHLPIAPSAGESPVPDKLVHFLMYAVLGVLLPLWNGRGERPGERLNVRRLGRLWFVIAGYAALDELLQLPVGRSAEWGDFASDLCGAAAGLALAAAARRAQASIQLPNSRNA